jgi:uncharacterized protein (DUF1697 family)
MTKYAAFLRGINVGGRIVKMADLKICLEKVGLSNVVTLLQSGNVVFESDLSQTELKKMVEATLTKTFHYPAKVQVLAIDRLQEIIEGYPFGVADNGQHDYVIFMENGLEKDLVNESYELAFGEQVKSGSSVVYWRVDKGSTLKSSFAKLLTKAKYKEFNTNRNLKTLKKLLVI